MNKKVLAVMGVTTLALGLTTACNNGGSDKKKIVMITDTGNIDDRSFNQGTWEGIEAYLEPKGYKENTDYKYIKPTEGTTAAYKTAIDDAVRWGAEAVICPGFLFEQAIYEQQTNYPNVKFLIEDGHPHNGKEGTEFDNTIKENTMSCFFKENESGFLAGYGAVIEGSRELGFMGGISVPAVKKFGAGYVAGAYAAAKDANVTISITDDHFEYLGTFNSDPAQKVKADAWYTSGVDTIFAAAGGAGTSVISSASSDPENRSVIGVDVDQYHLGLNKEKTSSVVMTSAMKNLSQAVEIFLDGVFGEDEFKHGEVTLGAKENGVKLPTEGDSWNFKTFTKEQYTAEFNKIKDGTIVVPSDYDTLKTYVEGLGLELSLTKNKVDDIKE